MMNKQIDIPAALYDDEVICFIADRYHTTPEKVVQFFLAQDSLVSEPEEDPIAFRLENNEMEILRGLTHNSYS